MREPSGDQSILSATPPAGATTRRARPPFALTTKIAALCSLHWRRKAISRPSGDKVGVELSPATRTIRNPLPPARLSGEATWAEPEDTPVGRPRRVAVQALQSHGAAAAAVGADRDDVEMLVPRSGRVVAGEDDLLAVRRPFGIEGVAVAHVRDLAATCSVGSDREQLDVPAGLRLVDEQAVRAAEGRA